MEGGRRSFGEFVLRDRIGEGGFGAVYRATQRGLDREAVVKVLHARLAASPAATERFLREARLASKLDHPYAAHIYAFGAEDDGHRWIAMELVRGTPLDQVLKLQGPISLERFVPLLDRICEVVHTAHEQGIVHRDLKPANVMVLSRAGRLLPKLLDLGIAKGLGEREVEIEDTIATPTASTVDSVELADTLGGAPQQLTQRGAVMGSPPYMAPEQWTDASAADARTDLYALGVLAYECLVGKPPFLATTLSAMAKAHARESVPSLGPRFPAALDAVLARALAKRQDDRYPDALAFASAFRHAANVGGEVDNLPAIDAAVRDAAINGAPQPIAEALAAYEAARNPHQARDALVIVGRAITRYLGALALGCRAHVAGDVAAPELVRVLTRRALTDVEWLELGKELTRGWLHRRDAYPLPELVGAFHDGDVVQQLAELATLHGEVLTDARLEATVERVGKLLGALAFVRDYPLVVTTGGGYAERWMGVRRAQRSTLAVRDKRLAAGVPALVDGEGAPVLVLAPLAAIDAPAPGAPLELFLLDGRDRRGARMISLPTGFEHHDDTLWDWLRAQLTGSLDDIDGTSGEERPPYRGLAAFSTDDSSSFFGREKLVDAFVNRLKVQPLLAVVGGSGAGKSSFVQAGVIPALPAGWRAITMRPGHAPLTALAARLEHAGILASEAREPQDDRGAVGRLVRADATARGPILLVVDQLEELFTLCADAVEREAFAETLASAARAAEDPVRVVLTLRDDFLVRAQQLPALRHRIGQALELLGVPAPDDLVRIISEPARRLGYEIEDGLASAMVGEVAQQPGALALLSFASSKLWELRDRQFRQLTRAAYDTLGGVGGALARHAELTLEAMLPEERTLTREVFRHLVTTQNTRAVLSRDELRQIVGGGIYGEGVIEKLVSARLLVVADDETGRETVEIIHEALLVAWPRLVEWRSEDSEGIRFREQLRSAAKQWDERARPEGLLWRGEALTDYTRWRSRQRGALTDVEAAFADASLAASARGRRNRRVAIVVAFCTLAVVAVALALLNSQVKAKAQLLNVNLRDQLEDQARRALLADDPVNALATLARATELGATGHEHAFLVAAAARATDGEWFELVHADGLFSARFSQDGSHILTAGRDHRARVWDTRRQRAQVFDVPNDVPPSFAPDGRSVLTANGQVGLLSDTFTGQPLQRLDHGAQIKCAAYSHDGAHVLTAGADDMIAMWRVETGERELSVHGGGAGMTACAFVGDGLGFAAGDARGKTWIWDPSGAPVRDLGEPGVAIDRLVVAPDGATLVVNTAAGSKLWRTRDGAAIAELSRRAGVLMASFSSDGRHLVTAHLDHAAVVWDAHTGTEERTLRGHDGTVYAATFSPDGTMIATASNDATAMLWDARDGRLLARWHGHRGWVRSIQFDATGAYAVTAGDDGRAIVWRAAPQTRIVKLAGQAIAAAFSRDGGRVFAAGYDRGSVADAITGHDLASLAARGVQCAAFTADGAAVVTLDADGLGVWNAATGVAAHRSTAATHCVGSTWSADGRGLVVADEDGTITQYAPMTGSARVTARAPSRLTSAAGDATGARLVTTGEDNTIRVWDSSGRQLASFTDSDGPMAAAFDPAGTRLVVALSRERLKIIDIGTGQMRSLRTEVGLTDVAWSPDGALVAAAALDGTARIWDAERGDELAIVRHLGTVFVTRFSTDSKRLLVGGDDSIAIYNLPERPEVSLDELVRCRVPPETAVVDRTGCDRDLAY